MADQRPVDPDVQPKEVELNPDVTPITYKLQQILSEIDTLRFEVGEITEQIAREKPALGPSLDALRLVDDVKKAIAELRKDLETGRGAEHRSLLERLKTYCGILMTRASVVQAATPRATFTLDADVKPSIPPVHSDLHRVFLDWLRSAGYGDSIREDIPWQTARALLRERAEKGMEFPSFIKINTYPTVKIRRK